MSNQDGNEFDWAPPGAAGIPGPSAAPQQPVPGPQQPPMEPYFGESVVSTGTVRTGAGWGRVALLATVLVVAAAAGFALWRALDGPSGPATPEEAAAQLFESVDNEDLLGVIEVLLPSERESMVEPATDLVAELVRLDVLSDQAIDDGELADISGITFDFAHEGELGELAYEVAPLGGSESVRWVTVTDGTVEVAFDPAAAQDGLGEAALDWAGIDPAEELEIQTETVDLGAEYDRGEPLEFAVVEEDGAWYVSLWYTVAGIASDGEAPNPLAAPAPVGGGSPEEAAEQFLRSVIELDVGTGVATLDPQEFRALYDYWGRIGPDIVEGASEARGEAAAEGFSWAVESVSASSSERNGRTVATFDELAVRFASTASGAEADVLVALGGGGLSVDGTVLGAPFEVRIDQERATGHGTIEGDDFEFDIDVVTYEGYFRIGPDRVDLSREGDCLVVSVDGEREVLCDEEFGLGGSTAALDIQADWQTIADRAGTPGLTMVERDGRWYVSGFPTWMYGVTDFLKATDREQLDELVDSYRELLDSFAGPAF